MAAEPQILTKPRSAAQIRLRRTELEVNARTKQYLLCKTKPISQPLLMNLTSALTSTYEHKPPLEAPKNKANQSQFQTQPLLKDFLVINRTY